MAFLVLNNPEAIPLVSWLGGKSGRCRPAERFGAVALSVRGRIVLPREVGTAALSRDGPLGGPPGGPTIDGTGRGL